MEVLKRQLDLSHVVRAGHTPSCLSGCLHGWQKQAYQNTNDGNDHQQFYQGKCAAEAVTVC
jgi:hypothetical protein